MDKNLEDTNRHNILQLAKDLTYRGRWNTVFIFGAGASDSAGVPLASELKGKIEVAFKDELSRILQREGISLKSASLEAILSAYRELTGDEDAPYKFLHAWLPSIEEASNRKLPLGYVITGHLMEQDLIRHIISLNQDELLDRVLLKMLGRARFRYIRSKSLFKFLSEQIEQSLEALNYRVLLKPHGTITLSATLRVDLKETQRFEKEKQTVLERVLDNKNVVLVGYSFNDGDMQYLIMRMSLEGRLNNIYIVNPDKDLCSKNPKVKDLEYLCKQMNKQIRFIVMRSDSFFKELSTALYQPGSFTSDENQIKKIADITSYYPKVSEHRIRDMIFSFGVEPKLENKILIEIIIFAIKARGKFKVKALLECQWLKSLINDYMQMKKVGESKAFELPLTHLLNKLEKWGIIRLADSLGLGEETYYLEGKTKEQMIDMVVDKLSQNLGLKPPKEVKEKLQLLMGELVEEFDYKLINIPVQANVFCFNKVELVTNRQQFKLYGEEIIEESEELFIVAETGEYLTKLEPGILKNKKLHLGISDPIGPDQPQGSFHRERALEVLSKLINLEYNKVLKQLHIFFIPWQENCHHMTVGKEKGLYFYREGKSTIFCVVLVRGDDLVKLKSHFNVLGKRYREQTKKVWDCLKKNYGLGKNRRF